MAERLRVVIIGSGNIGSDLMAKVGRSDALELVGMAGIDPDSPGLARAREAGITTSSVGLEDLLSKVSGVDLAFDATSAYAHAEHAEILAERGISSVDLTPAALGPAVIPAVNIDEHRDAPDVNLVTCGAQATIPVVAAIADVTDVPYAEIVSTISAASAGPGTRANIDEFTESTARALEAVGGAKRGKAIMLLNPADPPVLMRNAIFADVPGADHDAVLAAVESVVGSVAEVAGYVPGYRLKQAVQVDPIAADEPLDTLIGVGAARPAWKVSVFLEVEGAAHYLPAYAGNLDIMTSAAVRLAELRAGVTA